MPLDSELKDGITKGVALAKPDEAEMKAREEEKKKRQEELDKLKASLGE